MLRTLLFALLMCGGCVAERPVTQALLLQCPAVPLRQLTCREAVEKTTELQVVVDRVRAANRFTSPVLVQLVPTPPTGRHDYHLTPEPHNVRLLVGESFLRQVNRVEVVERAICGRLLNLVGQVVTDNVNIRQCVLLSALAAGETDRARWLLRTLPPPEFRPNSRPERLRVEPSVCEAPCLTYNHH